LQARPFSHQRGSYQRSGLSDHKQGHGRLQRPPDRIVPLAANSRRPSRRGQAYLAVFAMAVSFAGIPAVGAAVVGWAAVLASQGKLNIFVMLIVAVLGAKAGGLAGYSIGDPRGRKFLDRPGRRHEERQKAAAKAEALYPKWDVSPSFSRQP
jgi:membrane protein YqaA with SNARE-associated domain